MNFLAINTAGSFVEVAVCAGNKTEYYVNDKKELASVILLQQIDGILDRLGISLSEIDYFAGVVGPGSFTGIRIGIASVRAFCQSLRKKAIAINHLQLLAYNSRTDCEYIVAVISEAGGASYVSVLSGDAKTVYLQPSCIKTSGLKSFLDEIEESFIIVSDSLIDIDGYDIVHVSKGGDGLVGLAEYKISCGECIEYADLEPLYIRKSQAERQEGEL